MKRALVAILVVAGLAVGIVSALGVGGEDERYLVRAVFDNGAFVVNDEDVKVGGANVGSVHSVDVAMPDEPVSEPEGPDGPLVPNEGAAIVVLEITDPGFQDFRADGSCMIRAQSLVGEKFIDCRPTLPRAPGSEAPPPLEQVSDDQPGAGQYLLPLENNGKTVDVDLVNDIMRKPYADRFRLLLNGLGAGFAARGPDLAEIVRRANPALRDTDRILAILAAQRNQLAQLTADSDAILEPLAREREHVSGFFANAGAAGEATAERGDELEASFERFPGFLAELRTTMSSLENFSDGAFPVAEDFNRSANDLAAATRKLTPFLGKSVPALKTLGEAGVEAGPDLAASQPLIEQVNTLGRTGKRPLRNGAAFLGSLRDKKGLDRLMDLIYNTGGSVNGFDSYGHLLRSMVVPTNCVDYTVQSFTGCNANFKDAKKSKKKKKKKKKGKKSTFSASTGLIPELQPGTLAPPTAAADPGVAPGAADATPTPEPDMPPEMRDSAMLLDWLFGP